MNFINNYAEQVQLAQGADSLALDLFNGSYRLTLSDGVGASATRWEYVDAVVLDGVATLTRALEDTEDQEWPAGSWIYCSVTARVMTDLVAQTTELEKNLLALDDYVFALTARVEALEAPN